MSGWPKVRLKELVVEKGGIQTGPFGSQLHQKDYVEKGTPIITVEHLGDNRIIHSNLPRVTDEDKKRLARYHLKLGDIVFSRVGSVDRRAIVREEEAGWLFSGRCLRVRTDSTKCCPEFLSYQFGLETFKEHIRAIAVGATMPSLNTDILSNVQVIVPPLLKQKAIARVLRVLDEKIELNRRMNETLEAMARALFKSWFVDFDPVHAKAADKQPAGLSPEIADLFPSTFTDSPLGPIPTGWKISALEDLVDVSIGRTPPRKETEHFIEGNSGKKWISIRDLADSGVFVLRTSESLTPLAVEKFRVPVIPTGSIVVSFKLTVGRVAIIPEEMYSNEAIAHLKIKEREPIPTCFVYFAMKSYDYNSLGSTSSIATAVNSQSIKQAKVLNPSKALIDAFADIVNPIMNKLLLNQKQMESLSAIRDILLPLLISGQLRVASNVVSLAEEIKKRALKSCCDHGYVDIEQICREHGIGIVQTSNLGAKAELRHENGSFIIHVGDKKNTYNAAHELAHYAISTHRQKVEDHGKAARQGEASLTPAEEKEAEDLAAEILMPEEFVRELFGAALAPKAKTIKKCAAQLRVSEKAMHYRLTNLGYKPPYKDFRNYQETI